MIIVYHKHNQVVSVFDTKAQNDLVCEELNVVNALMLMASHYQERIIVWCHSDQKQNLNLEAFKQSLYLKNSMVSFNAEAYLPPQIGYVEDSPFIQVNKEVVYPTWQMGSLAGAMYGFQLLKFNKVICKDSLDYTLNSIAKLGMQKGLFCYSVPSLLTITLGNTEQANTFTLFKFVKQHYRTRWVFLLALNYVWHEKRLMFWPLLKSLFYKKKKFDKSITLESFTSKDKSPLPTIDVIIPTIGREQYVYDVLKDLAVQTHLPKQVIVVEQNPDMTSKTHLGFIGNEEWPFKVVHYFIHQTGACNARNLALKDVLSDYVYLADDDIRFESSLLGKSLKIMIDYKLSVITFSCLQRDEVEQQKQPKQWSTFGAGCSIMDSKFLNSVSFNPALEFGYGEDVDFGMQLRNLGADIIYMPEIKILHLKAPIGGFRSTFKQAWLNDEIQPKPSPTIMFHKMANQTEYQLLGYKTVLLINYYFKQKVKNPIGYFRLFNKQWQQSVFWANQLNEINT